MEEPLTNIGLQQRKTRRWLGIFSLTVAAGLAWAAISAETGISTLIVFFVFTQSGIVLLLEDKHGVCPVNAMRGRQSMEGYFSIGRETFARPDMLGHIRRIAYRDLIRATTAAFIATLLLAVLA